MQIGQKRFRIESERYHCGMINMGKENNSKSLVCRDGNNISVCDQYESLWRCRDFELSHLWQRSVFLQALLLLCFTGYGSLLLKAFEMSNTCLRHIGDGFYIWLHALSAALAAFAMMVSVLWIMMAKASKLWYERYEHAIDAFIDFGGHKYVDAALKNNSGTWAGFKFHQIAGYEEPPSDKALETTRGGRYSPSRLNIVIGQLSLAIWMLVASWHLANLVLHAGFTVVVLEPLWLLGMFTAFLCLVALIVKVFSKLISRKRGWVTAGSSYG